MTQTPEVNNPATQIPTEIVREIPETPEIPEKEQQITGVTVPQTQFNAQVTDDTGQQLINSPATKQITVEIPTGEGQLLAWSKGSPSESLTGYAMFWLRLIRKALQFGWRIVVKGGS